MNRLIFGCVRQVASLKDEAIVAEQVDKNSLAIIAIIAIVRITKNTEKRKTQ